MKFLTETEPSLQLPHENQIKIRPSTLRLKDLFEQSKPDLLSPTLDSGYSTRNVTPESETAPEPKLDFDNLCKKLESISTAKVVGKSWLEASTPVPTSVSDALLISKPSPDLPQYVGQQCTFWIRNEPHSEFDCFATGPTGLKYPVISELQLDLGQFKMTFVPKESGTFTVNVLSKANRFELIEALKVSKSHLVGSPFSIAVSRNYALASFGRPIVSIDMEHIHGLRDIVMERKPWGITTNNIKEQIIVTDREHHQILFYSPDGEPLFSFGEFGSRTSQFKRPTGIVYDSIKDRIYVTDKDNHRVQVFTSLGGFILTFGGRGKLNGQFNFPWGIAVSKCGEMIVVADSRNHRLQLFNSDGKFIRKYSDGGLDFEYPRGVDFDASGNYVYVTDFNLHRVLRLDVNFTTCKVIVDESQLKRPQGIHIDSNGQLLVASSRENCIKIFNPQNGNLLQEITSVNGSTLELPLSMVTMYAGFLATLDLNGRISIF